MDKIKFFCVTNKEVNFLKKKIIIYAGSEVEILQKLYKM